jgi:hypothetical protein
MLKKYNDILNEKKDMKAEKTGIEAKITKLFTDKPEIKASGSWPDAKCIYGLANIKKYVGGDTAKVDQIFNDMRKDGKIKSIKVKIAEYNETYPYFYHEDHTSKEEAEKCKANMEKSQKPAEKKAVKSRELPPERVVAKKKEVAAKPRAPRAPRKPAEKKVVGEKDLKVKAKAVIKRKK